MSDEAVEIGNIQRRVRDLALWVKENGPQCMVEQKHCEEGSPERLYWHYGYLVAMRDILHLFGIDEPITPTTTKEVLIYQAEKDAKED